MTQPGPFAAESVDVGGHRPPIVTATLMREAGPSGVQSHIRTVDAYLRSVGQPVRVITPFSSSSPLVRPVFGLRYALAPFSSAGGIWWYNHWHQHFLADALEANLAALPPGSVVYAQCPLSAEAALRVGRDHRVVMAVHFHVSQADEWAAKGHIRSGGRLYSSIRDREQRVLPRLDGVVYVSRFMQATLEERIPSLARVPSAVIPNFVAVGEAASPTPRKDLVTIGALEPHKNHQFLLDVLVAARARGRRYSLSIIGEGPLRPALERAVLRLDLADQVTLLGYRSDARALIGEHRLYVHASTMESFGIAIVEAMGEAVPVLAGAVGGIPEIIRPGVDGSFWSLGDAAAAADDLICLMEQPDRLAGMGRTARARVAADYSTDVVGRQLLGFLSP